MSDVVTVRGKLAGQGSELERLSRALSDVSDRFDPVAEKYRQFVDHHELGLLSRSETDDGYRLPSEALRLKLAHAAMNPEALGLYMGLKAKRDSLQREIRDLKAAVEVNRSILSALKVEMEATR